MVTTGIVRRIDDLGRVVIPKEIRKTLRIKEGDPLEIYTNKEELIFKKFSPMASLKANASLVAGELNRFLERDCVILDTDNVICVSDSKNKAIIGAIMSDQMSKIINSRRNYIASSSDGGIFVKIYKGDENMYENQMIVPILSGGDLFGAIVVFDKDRSKRFTSADEKMVMLGAKILSAQFEI